MDASQDLKLMGSTGWGNCPADLLMIIFKQLEPKCLLNCMGVNEWWRDVADYVAKRFDLWPDIAQEGLVNRGVTFKRKSSPETMRWRDLYVNSCLWKHVKAARIAWKRICSIDDIKSIHVYQGFLIVMHHTELDRKYYKISNIMQELRARPKKPVAEEGPIARAVRDEALANNETSPNDDHRADSVNGRPASDVVEADRMILKLAQEKPFKRLIVFDDNCYYVLDDRNIMRCFKWDDEENKWLDKTLARYYGCNKSICDIHVSHDDVYILLRKGHVMRVDREGRNFELLHGMDFPPQTLSYYARMFYCNIPMRTLDTVFRLDIPEYSTGSKVMFNKFSAVIAVPANKEFKINYHEGSDHVVMECPNLTSATEHGEVLFLGYKDGRVDICLITTLLECGYKPEVSVNVENYHQYLGLDPEIAVLDVDPAILSIEVYELIESHYLFVATSSNVYKLEITYPDDIKQNLVEAKIDNVCNT